MAPFPRGQALVIGVGAYNDPRWDAPTAARDAQGCYDTLVDPDLGGYGRGQAELLLDREATRQGVLAALGRLANRCSAESVAVVSLTCHGALGDDGLYYLATSDARFAPAPAERVVRDTGLHVGELARALRAIPARQLLLVVNACFAGALGGALGRGGIAPEAASGFSGQMLPDEAGAELLAAGEGRAIITASRADQRSYFPPDERHSFFGQALIDALKGDATSAGRGYLGLYELYESVFRQVRDVTLRRLGAAQEPMLTMLQHAGPFVVARYPRATSDDEAIANHPPTYARVRVVQRDVVVAAGDGATAIKAERGSSVVVDSRNRVHVSFEGATVGGGVTLGDVAAGSVVKGGGSAIVEGDESQAGGALLHELPILRERVAAARDVDEDARDDAANKLNQAQRALAQGDRTKAAQRLDEALAILGPIDNGYIRSVARKIATLRDGL